MVAATVAELMRDAGLAARIDGEVFKALPNLDAYTLVAGGG
jgi:hypothetical protein